MSRKQLDWKQYIVTAIFIVLSLVAFVFSNRSLGSVTEELTVRMVRNAFLVLSLIVPIIAGMGINFGIGLGAMAAQLVIIIIHNFEMQGIIAFIAAFALTLPLAACFGFLYGKMLNKIKGQEMIGGMIMTYFSKGIYEFITLYAWGRWFYLNPKIAAVGGIGVTNTLDLNDSFGYVLNQTKTISLFQLLLILTLSVAGYGILQKKKETMRHSYFHQSIPIVGLFILLFIFRNIFFSVRISIVSILPIILLMLFNHYILKTKIGHDMKAVGQSQIVSQAAGIDVNRVRITAIVISTVLAAWGQLFYLQNMKIMNTYGTSDQVGLFAAASLLVGGASITCATNRHVMIGLFLFHSLFILAPSAAQNLLGNPMLGEYFRVFVTYGVIALSLIIYEIQEQHKIKN